MLNRIKTGPVIEPVSLCFMRKQLGITQDDNIERDGIISERIKAARRWAEIWTGRAFVTQTWTHHANSFPEFFDLIPDLQSVTHVKYLDTNGVQQTLPAADYLVDTISSRVYEGFGKTWPTVRAQVNSIEIEYISGYGLPPDVPEDIRDAIRFIVGHWENFQSNIEGVLITTVPYAVEQLLRPYRDMRQYI